MDILSPITDLGEIAERVLGGEVFLYPTDTVAGIGCIASNENSVNRIFAIKSRDAKKSVSFAFSNVENLEQYVIIPDFGKKYLSLLPGALTLVLNQKQNSPVLYGISGKTIGARIPNVPWLLYLISKVDYPLVTTSANISGEDPSSRFELTNPIILEQVDFAIPWENDLSSSASTVISLLESGMILLREGAISKQVLNQLSGTKTF